MRAKAQETATKGRKREQCMEKFGEEEAGTLEKGGRKIIRERRKRARRLGGKVRKEMNRMLNADCYAPFVEGVFFALRFLREKRFLFAEGGEERAEG